MVTSNETTDLVNKPLVEAWIELKWALEGEKGQPQVDPEYRFLLGRLYDQISERFPAREALPTASIPDEMVCHVVQHRFKPEEGTWPIVQVGPAYFPIMKPTDTVGGLSRRGPRGPSRGSTGPT